MAGYKANIKVMSLLISCSLRIEMQITLEETLTNLRLMEFSTLVNWTNPFRIKGSLGSYLQFHS